MPNGRNQFPIFLQYPSMKKIHFPLEYKINGSISWVNFRNHSFSIGLLCYWSFIEFDSLVSKFGISSAVMPNALRLASMFCCTRWSCWLSLAYGGYGGSVYYCIASKIMVGSTTTWNFVVMMWRMSWSGIIRVIFVDTCRVPSHLQWWSQSSSACFYFSRYWLHNMCSCMTEWRWLWQSQWLQSSHNGLFSPISDQFQIFNESSVIFLV